jgi:transcriptional regulator GlxA family with amidase domain
MSLWQKSCVECHCANFLICLACSRMKIISAKKSSPPHLPRRIGIIAFPDSQILDISGPLAVFNEASRQVQKHSEGKQAAYQIELISTAANKLVDCYCGVSLTAHTDFRSAAANYDTLLVAGGYGVMQAATIDGFLPWLQKQAGTARRVGSVCSGAVVLAAAGLLDGRRATTHWYYCQQIAQQFPKVNFDADPIFIRDGNIYTSAGVTAGIDLALALVEEDLGADIALFVARALIVFLRRPGSQSQFSQSLSLQTSDRKPLRELQAWLLENLREPLTVEQMADRVGMSPRNFARVFTEQLGMPPARFVSQIRLETARRRLEESSQSIEIIAEECGFGSTESMRSAFQRVLRVSPQDYRNRFYLTEEKEPDNEPFIQPPRLSQSHNGSNHQHRIHQPTGKSERSKIRHDHSGT